MKQTDGTNTLKFSYSPDGKALGVIFNGTSYYYIYNLQGDVIGLYDSSGNVVVEYTYDSWGKLLDTTGSLASTLGYYNPFRYRGYIYDEETALYYLRSRYYDPEIGRFINADGLVSTGTGLSGYNMFSYCNNNPVNNIDSSGELLIPIICGFVIGTLYNHGKNAKNEKKIKKEIKDTYTKQEAKEAIDPILEQYSTDCEIIFKNDNAQINNSYCVDNKYDRQKIAMIISRTEGLTDREFDNISAEWYLHNFATPIPSFYEQAHTVNIDYDKDARWYVNLGTFIFEVIGWE